MSELTQQERLGIQLAIREVQVVQLAQRMRMVARGLQTMAEVMFEEIAEVEETVEVPEINDDQGEIQ